LISLNTQKIKTIQKRETKLDIKENKKIQINKIKKQNKINRDLIRPVKEKPIFEIVADLSRPLDISNNKWAVKDNEIMQKIKDNK